MIVALLAIFLMVRRNLRQHALSTAVTAICVALACGLVIAVFAIRAQSYEAFAGGSTGFDAVLGARGSPLQLVLNSVFHIEASPGNIPWSMYESMKKNPAIRLAIPYAVGDNFKGFRLVGTSTELFEKYEFRTGKKLVFEQGKSFDAQQDQAVLGSFAARNLGLKIGEKFHSYHGLTYSPTAEHEDLFEVVGILETTNSPIDHVIWIPIDSYFHMSGHEHGGEEKSTSHDEHDHDADHREVSAVMIKFRSPAAGLMLSQNINRNDTRATLAFPIAIVMKDLLDKIGWANEVLALVAYLVAIVAAGSILASLYNTMQSRRRELAILRAIGARRRIILASVLLESMSTAALGSLLGLAVYLLLAFIAARVVREQTGVVLEIWRYHSSMLLTPLGMILLGGLAGIIPALQAYRTDVAQNLAPTM